MRVRTTSAESQKADQDNSEFSQLPNLPKPPARVFMVGIGGIGMSGLAQLLRWEGYAVAGSDRGLGEPGKAELYRALKRQGVFLYPQDGSGIHAIRPDILIHSTAVENGNPDFLAAEELGVPRIHRARALSQALAEAGGELITVAGSCGKTSVTGWIASALRTLGETVLVVNGGYEVDSVPGMPGNFRADQFPRWLVAEVDESDKSLDQFTPDYGLLLNVGNDHYDQTELRRVFTGYLNSCRKAVVTSAALRELATSLSTPVALFGETAEDTMAAVRPVNYQAEPEGIEFDATDVGHVRTSQYGRHSAANASAVLSLLRQLGLGKADEELCRAIGAFQGIRQRFEVVGHLGNGTPLVNDYAHNPEKVSAAIEAARERFGSPLFLAFQPHGFTPFGFMRQPLGEALARLLQPDDRFILLPVFYAGGTAAFTPTSDEVAREYAALGLPVMAATRSEAEGLLHAMPQCKAAVVMGARDSSLRDWTIGL